MSIIVTGHPYAFPHYFRVFEYAANRNELVFVLPKVWKSKTEIKLEKKEGFNIYGLNAWSYGRASFLGGAFKGWLPGIMFLLPYLKLRFRSKVLYSCSEPNLLTTLYNGLIAKILGLKLILFTWQNVPPEKRPSGWKLKLSHAIVALNLKLVDGIICGNKKAEEIVKRFNKKTRTTVCPLSGVDIQKFRPGISSDWKEKLGLSGKKVLLFCGALDKRKGIEVLLGALALISDKSVYAIIVGTGAQKEKLVSLASELSIKERVVFLDWMRNEELPGLLNAADVFVYPSRPLGGWEEQFGYAMAEASACGIPIVATRSGSIGEVVVDGKSGILVEPNNSEQLADAIGKILSNNDFKKQMGDYGLKYIGENFSHQVVANKLSNFLHGFVK